MARELPVEAVRRVTIGAVCIFSRVECSEAVKATAANNSCSPPALVARDALITARVVVLLRTVEAILLPRRLAQICNSIVRPVTVYVVDLVIRPLTVNKKSREPVGEKSPIKTRYFDVPVSVFSSRYFPNTPSGSARPDIRPMPPGENSDARIVGKTAHQKCACDRLAAIGVMCNAWRNHWTLLRSLVRSRTRVCSAMLGFAIMPHISVEA